MPKSSHKKTTPQRPLFIVCIGLVLLAGLYLALHFFTSTRKEPPAVIENNQQAEKAQGMRQQPGMKQAGTQQVQTPAPTGAKQKKQIMASEEAPIDLATQCPVLDKELSSLFQYLDEQPYIQDYQLKKGSLAAFKKILAKLLSNPPEVQVAHNNLLGKMKNMAHFYRVLGSKNIFLAKSYLANEEGRIENDLAAFYQWFQLDSCRKQHTSLDLSLPLPPLYDYAAYFLTSPGGKAYLFRRKEHIALLVQYYCILLVDQANKVGLNHYGIKLAPFIDKTLTRMQQSTSLQNSADYLKTLHRLRQKYAAVGRKGT